MCVCVLFGKGGFSVFFGCGVGDGARLVLRSGCRLCDYLATPSLRNFAQIFLHGAVYVHANDAGDPFRAQLPPVPLGLLCQGRRRRYDLMRVLGRTSMCVRVCARACVYMVGKLMARMELNLIGAARWCRLPSTHTPPFPPCFFLIIGAETFLVADLEIQCTDASGAWVYEDGNPYFAYRIVSLILLLVYVFPLPLLIWGVMFYLNRCGGCPVPVP